MNTILVDGKRHELNCELRNSICSFSEIVVDLLGDMLDVDFKTVGSRKYSIKVLCGVTDCVIFIKEGKGLYHSIPVSLVGLLQKPTKIDGYDIGLVDMLSAFSSLNLLPECIKIIEYSFLTTIYEDSVILTIEDLCVK